MAATVAIQPSMTAPLDPKSTTPQPPPVSNENPKANEQTASVPLPAQFTNGISNGGTVPQPLSSRRSDKLDLDTVERKGKQQPGWRQSASRQHAGGIKEAPTYRPSEEEWKNPMAYIRKIAPEGSKYGIIKIVPPDSWSSEFAMDTTRFHFKTRKQELNSVEGGTRANSNYLDQLQKFHKQFGHTMARFPSVDKKPLDLYELKKAVQARGGLEKVCERKRWAEIGRALGYSGKIMSSLSTSLKNSYEKWLHPFEQWMAGAKPGVQMQLEQERGGPYGTPSPGMSPFSPVKRSNPHTPSGLSREAGAVRASHALQMSVGGREAQSQPPEAAYQPLGTGSFPTSNVNQVMAFPAATSSFQSTPSFSTPMSNGPSSQSDYRYPSDRAASLSFSAIPRPSFTVPVSQPNGHAPGGTFTSFELKRSHSDMTEDDKDRILGASDRQAKKQKPDPAPTVTGSHMFQHNHFPNLAASFRATTNGQTSDRCETCQKIDNPKTIVTCEECDNAYHMKCLDPPLLEAPSHEWHCPRCLIGTGEYGFEEGGVYSLKQFQQKAGDFKEHYFKGKTLYDPISDKHQPVTEDQVEKEFWRLVTNVNETVEVEYGADIHSTTHGSGFPSIERNPRDPMSTDPWNLNVLPLHQESLFKHIKSDISGMTVPWLYVGMCFSTFCWHIEDHYAYSANYQHFGATKTWYGVPSADADKFENAMKAHVPELFESQPDLLDQLTTLLPPETLHKAGVSVYAVDQRAGQFVITFPQAYHAGFNHGFNFNEAVNFAPSDWEPFGRAGVERRREFRKQPCFSHDELLFTAAGVKDVPIKTARWLAPALEDVCKRELSVRETFESQVAESKFFKLHGDDSLRLPFDRHTDLEDLAPELEEEYVCHFCKAYSYLSRLVCEKTKKVTCLDHVAMVDWGQTEDDYQLVLHFRLTTPKLQQMVQRIKDTSTRPDAWLEKFHIATEGIEKPALKTMKTLLSEGERIPWPLKELPTLRKSVEVCDQWITDAAKFTVRKPTNRNKEKVKRKGSSAKVADVEEQERETRSIKGIRRLLSRAQYMAFDAPEIVLLQEKLDTIEDFRHSIKKALSTDALRKGSVDELEALIEEGKGLSVDIPETGTLEKILEQMRWINRANAEPEYSTMVGVDELLDEAIRLNVPQSHERVVFLRDRKHHGELLQKKIMLCLNQVDGVDFAELEGLAKHAAKYPVSNDIVEEMNNVLRTHREAQKRVRDLITAAKDPDLRKRPTYHEMKECMTAVLHMPNRPDGVTELEKLQKKHEDWMRRGKKLFGKTNAPLHILLQYLKIVDERNKSCLDTTERPRPPNEPQSRSNSPAPDFMDSMEVYCLCRKPEEGQMIECKTCHEWYHSTCLKIARGKYKADDDFDCPVCDHTKLIPRDAIRPRFEQFECWQSEISGMPFQSDEEETINSIVAVARNFCDYIKPHISNPHMVTMEEVPTLRFYLRKIEGAEILLAEETNFFRRELYRLHPIAPEPPLAIVFSSSTRKPRPTKEQRLMKEHGVMKPEDLPAHVRNQKHGKSKRLMNEKDREDARARGERVTTPQLLFRKPLTSDAFPKKEKSRPDSVKSPNALLGKPAGSQPPSNASVPPQGSPLMSPSTFAEAENGSTSGPLSSHDPNIDPAFDTTESMDAMPAMPPSPEGHQDDIYGAQDGPEQGTETNFDSMFADLTNDDNMKDDVAAEGHPIVDLSLIGA